MHSGQRLFFFLSWSMNHAQRLICVTFPGWRVRGPCVDSVAWLVTNESRVHHRSLVSHKKVVPVTREETRTRSFLFRCLRSRLSS